MQVPWWYGVTDLTTKFISVGQVDQENYGTNRSSSGSTSTMSRLPLRELNQTQSATPKCQVKAYDGSVKVRSNRFRDSDREHHSANVCIRNERERNRVKLLNLGFDRLRAVVPHNAGEQLSKISTLKKAIWYIEHLDRVLHGQEHATSGAVSSFDFKSSCTTPQSDNAGSGSKAQRHRASRRDRQLNCPQASPVGAINSQGADSLVTGTTSCTPLSHRIPVVYEAAIHQSRMVDFKTNDKQDVRDMAERQAPLSPIFPRQWGITNGESETPTQTTEKYTIVSHNGNTVKSSMPDYMMNKAPTCWLNSSHLYDSGYESPITGPEGRIAR